MKAVRMQMDGRDCDVSADRCPECRRPALRVAFVGESGAPAPIGLLICEHFDPSTIGITTLERIR